MKGSKPNIHILVGLLICAQVLSHSPSLRVTTTTANPVQPNKLLLMMYDGMRWDAASDKLPGMKMMIDNGVHAKQMKPCYPTSSVPNHFCILTGRYAESHGLIGNDMYDIESNETFRLDYHWKDDSDPRWWINVDPIWTAAVKQGKRVKVYNWMGCQMKTQGIQLTDDQCLQYDAVNTTDKLKTTVNVALKKLADDQLDFVAIYYPEPDDIQHETGVDSTESRKVIEQLDEVLLHLQQRADTLTIYDAKTKLSEKLNVILVSDHGQMNLTAAVNVTSVFAKYKYHHLLTSGQQLGVWPLDDASGNQIFDELKKIKNMKVYRKEEIPERWHYKHGKYVPPILAAVDPGFYFISPDQKSVKIKGSHGYDNDNINMQAVFLARGPNFKKYVSIAPVDNIELYQIMSAILEIKPSTNNGTWSHVEPFIVDLVPKRPSGDPVSFNSVIITVVVAVSSVLILTVVVCCIHYVKQRTRTKQYRTLPMNIENELENDELDL